MTEIGVIVVNYQKEKKGAQEENTSSIGYDTILRLPRDVSDVIDLSKVIPAEGEARILIFLFKFFISRSITHALFQKTPLLGEVNTRAEKDNFCKV